MILKRKTLAATAATWALTALAAVTLTRCAPSAKPEPDAAADSLRTPAPEMLYGIAMDSFDVRRSTVRPGQMITSILTDAGVPYPSAIKAYESAKPTYDFRKMRSGASCCMFHEPDTSGSGALRHFVYEISATDYIVCTFCGDSVLTERRSQPVTTVRKSACVTIESSLWNALSAAETNPQVALDLSDVFAWTVDFFGLEKGDRFGVMYDSHSVGGREISTGKIVAAVYMHGDRRQYAFLHETDSTSGYYDLKGNSMRRAFLKAPLHFSRISSRFSHGRMHPILKIRRPHHGVDYAAPAGTPVVSIGDGTVIAKGYERGGGNYVKIRHNSLYTSVYMHLRGFSKGIAVGKSVRQGEQIGTVGSTGLSTGPHLDFRIFREGKPIDPLKVDMPPTEPIDNDAILDFMESSERLKSSLDSLVTAR